MKKIVKFTKAHQIYSAGDIAGFDPATADDLIDKKKVAKAYEAPKAETQTLTITIESDEARAEIARQVAEAQADLEKKAEARSDELDAREAKLDEREKSIVKDEAEMDKYAGELDDLKADLDAREAALSDPAKADADAAKETTSAKPPKQGK